MDHSADYMLNYEDYISIDYHKYYKIQLNRILNNALPYIQTRTKTKFYSIYDKHLFRTL